MKKFLRAAICMLLIVSMLTCLLACDSKKEENQSGNSYTDALKAYEEYMNCKEFSFEKERALFGGLADKEMKTLYEILEKSSYGKSLPAEWQYNRDRNSQYYGEDYTISYKIESKEEINTDELAAFEEELKEFGELLKVRLARRNAEAIAEKLSISVEDAEKAMKTIESLADMLMEAEVSAGYKVDVVCNFSGSERKTSSHMKNFFNAILKVNGQWLVSPLEIILQNYFYGLAM